MSESNNPHPSSMLSSTTHTAITGQEELTEVASQLGHPTKWETTHPSTRPVTVSSSFYDIEAVPDAALVLNNGIVFQGYAFGAKVRCFRLFRIPLATNLSISSLLLHVCLLC